MVEIKPPRLETRREALSRPIAIDRAQDAVVKAGNRQAIQSSKELLLRTQATLQGDIEGRDGD